MFCRWKGQTGIYFADGRDRQEYILKMEGTDMDIFCRWKGQTGIYFADGRDRQGYILHMEGRLLVLKGTAVDVTLSGRLFGI